MDEQNTPTSSEDEDVEAHRLPPAERPPAERADDPDPDFEGHGLSSRPPAERPPAE